MKFDRTHMEGLKELDAKLAMLQTEVATKLGVQAVRKSSNVLAQGLRGAAPRSDAQSPSSLKYGRLSANVRVRKARSIKANYIVFNVSTGSAFWGNFGEFGTIKQPARPWYRPTVERLKDELVQVQVDTLAKGIDRIARRGARAGAR